MSKYIKNRSNLLLLIFLTMSTTFTVGCINRANSDPPIQTEGVQSSITPDVSSIAGDSDHIKQTETPVPTEELEIKIITPDGEAGEWYKIPTDLADVVKKFIQLKIDSLNSDPKTALDAFVTRKELKDIDISFFEGKSLSMKMDTSIPDSGIKYTCIDVFDDNNPDGEKLIFLLVQNSSGWQIDNVFVGTYVSVKNNEEFLKAIGSNKLIIASSDFDSFTSGFVPINNIDGYKNLIVVVGAWLSDEITFNNCENTFIYAISFGDAKETKKVNIKDCDNFISYHCTFSGGMVAESSNDVQFINCWFDCGKIDNVFEFIKCNDVLFDSLSVQNGDSFWNTNIKSIIKLNSCGGVAVTNNILDAGFKFIDNTTSNIVLSGNRVKGSYMDTSILFGDWDGNGKVQKVIINRIGQTDSLLTFFKEDGETELLQEYLTGTDNMAVEKSFINDVIGDGRDEIIYPALGQMISLNDKVLKKEAISQSIIKSDKHEWKVDLDNDGNEEDVQATLSIDITRAEIILLDLDILQKGQSEAKKQLELGYDTKNLIIPEITFEDIDCDGIKEIFLGNKMILKPMKTSGVWSSLQNLEQGISFNAKDYVHITNVDVEKQEIVLAYPGMAGESKTITIPVPIGIENNDKLMISESDGFYVNDINQDEIKELCIRSYLQIPYQRQAGLDDSGDDAICDFGNVASIDIYLKMNDNQEWQVDQVTVTPKYDSNNYNKYYKGEFMELFYETKNNPISYSFTNELLKLSNQINYYGASFWIPNYDLTTPQLMLKNGLAIGISKNDVSKIMGIPDVGNVEDNHWTYYCAYSGPMYQTMNIYFENDTVGKIELNCEQIFD